MSEMHLAYLNLGSNIQPESNLPKAVELLSQYGEIQNISSVWASEPVGTIGNNYLNACVKFKTPLSSSELKESAIHPIEDQLGRERSKNKFAPRSMDIDIILFDDEPVNLGVWEVAFVVVPLADIYPNFKITSTGETALETATRLRRKVWLETRQGVLG